MHPRENKVLNQKISVDLTNLLGKGSTGNVYKGTCLFPYPHSIAVKVIPLKQINNQVTSYLLQCELEALKKLSSSQNHCIVRLKEIIVLEEMCFIAMQLLEGGTLQSYISEMKKIPEQQAIAILEPLLKGYLLLKNNGIIHRDLKPGNIMFEKKNGPRTMNPKIIDFGYCEMECVKNKPNVYYNVGSPRYMSPEAYTHNQYSQKSDLWSLGIIFYEMLNGTTFDKGKEISETFQMVQTDGIPIPTKLTKKSKRILQSLLMFSPSQRSSVEQILVILNEPLKHQKVKEEPMNLSKSIPSKFVSLNNKFCEEYTKVIKQKPVPHSSVVDRSLNKVLMQKKNSFEGNKHFQSHNISKDQKSFVFSVDKKLPSGFTSVEGKKNQKGLMFRSMAPVKINITNHHPNIEIHQKNENSFLFSNMERNLKKTDKYTERINRIQSSSGNRQKVNAKTVIVYRNKIQSPKKQGMKKAAEEYCHNKGSGIKSSFGNPNILDSSIQCRNEEIFRHSMVEKSQNYNKKIYHSYYAGAKMPLTPNAFR